MNKKIYLSLIMLLVCCTAGLFAGKIHDAIENNDLILVGQLINEKANRINKVNENNQTPINLACGCDNLVMVTWLLPCCTKETISKPDIWSQTPLSLACGFNNLEMVKRLLPYCTKETINKADKNGKTPLFVACDKNNPEMVELLLPHCTKETINKADDYWSETPLFVACNKNNLDIVKLLLSKSITETINKAYKDGTTPLFVACAKNNLEMVKLLLPHCTKETINKANKDIETPFLEACYNGNLEMVKLLLPHCTKETIKNINKANNNNETPLYLAYIGHKLNMVKLLLANGAKESINIADKNGQTPLYCACATNDLEIITLFLLNGANIIQEKIKDATQVARPCLNLAHKFNSKETHEKKIKYILQKKDKKLFKFNFLVKLCFAESAQQIVDKSCYSMEKTAFFGLYNKLISDEAFGKDYLEKFFGLGPKKRTFIEFVIDTIRNEQNAFYFAKPLLKNLSIPKNLNQNSFSDMIIKIRK